MMATGKRYLQKAEAERIVWRRLQALQ